MSGWRGLLGREAQVASPSAARSAEDRLAGSLGA